jgi:hypothetical protein
MKTTTSTKVTMMLACFGLLAASAHAQVIGGKPKVGDSTAGVPGTATTTAGEMPVTESANQTQAQPNGTNSKFGSKKTTATSSKKAKSSKEKNENAEETSNGDTTAKHSKSSDSTKAKGKSEKAPTADEAASPQPSP